MGNIFYSWVLWWLPISGWCVQLFSRYCNKVWIFSYYDLFVLVNFVICFSPQALCPPANCCYVFGLKIGKLVELANHRVCELSWLQISDRSVIWTGLEAFDLGRQLFAFQLCGKSMYIQQMESASISGEEAEILRCSQSRKSFCIVNLIPTRCRQSCLRGGHLGSVIYKLHRLNW